MSLSSCFCGLLTFWSGSTRFNPPLVKEAFLSLLFARLGHKVNNELSICKLLHVLLHSGPNSLKKVSFFKLYLFIRLTQLRGVKMEALLMLLGRLKYFRFQTSNETFLMIFNHCEHWKEAFTSPSRPCLFMRSSDSYFSFWLGTTRGILKRKRGLGGSMPKCGWKWGWGGCAGCGRPAAGCGKWGWGGPWGGGWGGPTIPFNGGTEVNEVTGLDETVLVWTTAEFDVGKDDSCCWCCCCATCA